LVFNSFIIEYKSFILFSNSIFLFSKLDTVVFNVVISVI